MYLIDLAAHNAFFLFKIESQSPENNRLRRKSLENLSKELMMPYIKLISETLSRDPDGIKLNLIEAFNRVGCPIKKTDQIPKTNIATERKRCAYCEQSDNKHSKICQQCMNTICKQHSKEIKSLYFEVCF